MRIKYPNKKLSIIMDNLSSHKTSLIMRIAQKDYVEILFTSSNSPIFSPIENLFGYVKGKIKDLDFKTKE